MNELTETIFNLLKKWIFFFYSIGWRSKNLNLRLTMCSSISYLVLHCFPFLRQKLPTWFVPTVILTILSYFYHNFVPFFFKKKYLRAVDSDFGWADFTDDNLEDVPGFIGLVFAEFDRLETVGARGIVGTEEAESGPCKYFKSFINLLLIQN